MNTRIQQVDIQSSFSRLPEFVYFFYKQIQADNLSSRCPQSQPIKQKIKRKVKTNNTNLKELKLKTLGDPFNVKLVLQTSNRRVRYSTSILWLFQVPIWCIDRAASG